MESMKVQVVKVKQTNQGWNLAYCQCGEHFGSVIASPEVKEPGEYDLHFNLCEKEGRIVPLIRVEKPEAK